MKTVLIVEALLAIAVVGCSTEEQLSPVYTPSINVIHIPGGDATGRHISYTQELLDDFMARSLIIEDVVRTKTNDGYDRLEVRVKNLLVSPLRFRYRFDWEDANGVPRREEGFDAWEKTAVAPGGVKSISSIEPQRDCVDCRLQYKCIQQ